MLVAKSELYYYPEETLEVKDKPKKQMNKASKRNKKNNSIVKLIIICVPLIILGISLSILFRYANLTSIRRDITKLELEKRELEKTKMNLIGDLESLKSSVRIAEEATTKLGMDYPVEGQIVYVSINENSNQQVEEPTIKKQIKKVFSMVTNLF